MENIEKAAIWPDLGLKEPTELVGCRDKLVGAIAYSDHTP